MNVGEKCSNHPILKLIVLLSLWMKHIASVNGGLYILNICVSS